MPESFDEWYEIFQTGYSEISSSVRNELEERIEEAPTQSAREAAEYDLEEYLEGADLDEYDQWTAFEEMKYLADSPDEWERVRESYEELVGTRQRIQMGSEIPKPPEIPKAPGPSKKDGSPDMRYLVNRKWVQRRMKNVEK